MYIQSVEIKNIRSIQHFAWQLPEDQLAGWHVLIGDNGSGKSTVLRAIALGLIQSLKYPELRQSWKNWVRNEHTKGTINIKIFYKMWPVKAEIELYKTNKIKNFYIDREGESHAINFGFIGEFSVAYGPFRRFSGGEPQPKALSPDILAHLSIFGEDIALSESLNWLKELRFKELEQKPEASILPKIIHFVNQEDFLPYGVRLKEISSDGVFFEEPNGTRLLVEELGDGYRSVLSMTFDIIRQMQIAYQSDDLFSADGTQIIRDGVILIDEIDAHLHPEWQRRIGFWLTEHFPNIQFMVTTHSPLVCQAAVKGSIWRLPAPSSTETSQQIAPDSEEWKRLVYGNILEAYSTDLFGENIDRSDLAQKKYERLAELSAKELDKPLSQNEEAELETLLDELPSTPYKQLYGVEHD
jgi:predicted ATPase